MRSSKIYSILEHFNKYEQNRLRKYISSPYFNKDEKLIRLAEILIHDINKHGKAELEKNDIWESLNPKEAL